MRKKDKYDDTLKGVETVCPKCGYKLNYWFRSGKALISEFTNDLQSDMSTIQMLQKWQKILNKK